ncbi:BMP family ABC transporter substrate-binding protein [Candidatus Pseudothioglobus singularis]|jgi:basic membrane protein A|nr:BMP family ABC transporter substrate-binding protein [Candidatus Pseudothioglobus singularis]MDA9801371.1 BMP family ABC transporter substrate-binding protein [Candidatus Pseudothioglobus singularis]MDC0648596.1 BMP family ABC transporter substrate-binding protein [Candidatus Pseudothioglobus singularis]MDG1166380.1 BMP family ABC transporter substrate-binding protein [Candidatus Thioglobus sp.]MDG1344849.1 BMP family ABC transporter substrate-binding protein [Candidatus Thioglobus sp.]
MKNMKRSHLSGLIKKTGLAVIASTFLLAAPIAQADGHVKPAVVYDTAGKNDKSFNEAVFNGITRFMNDTGIAVTELEPTNEAMMEQSLKKFAQRGYSPVVAVGFTMANAVAAAAAEYPDTQFTIIDGVVDAPNVQNVIYKEHEGSFLVGVMAAMASNSGTVGFVGGMDIPLISRFECGYKQGVAHADSSMNVLAQMTGSTPAAWGNPTKGGEITRSQVENGADVVYAAAGGTGIGVYQTAADMGVLAIGVDSNQNYMQPGTMLTSMYKKVGLAAYNSFAAAVAGNWEAGFSVNGVAEDGVGAAMDEYNADLVSADMLAAVDTARAAIISGDIVVHDYMSDNSCPL